MYQWLELISTVRFDLEEGPVVDFAFPLENFKQDFIKKLAYPAFPNSYSILCDDQMFYSFMIQAKSDDRQNYIYLESQLVPSKTELEDEDNEEQNDNPEEQKDDKKIIQDYNRNKKNQYMKGI
jgi:hypothetical protein